MISEVVTNRCTLPEKTFEWRQKGGEYIQINKMHTRHLFYTLRMIWNHTMPMDARLTPFRMYSFGPVYTQEYLKRAVKEILSELCTREDIEADWYADIQHMVNYFNKKLPRETSRLSRIKNTEKISLGHTTGGA